MPECRQALDAALDPRAGGVCLGISHDGSTRATIHALDAAREAGAVTATIGARADSPTALGADHVIVTPLRDRSWCHTVAYSSTILAGAAIAREIAGGRRRTTRRDHADAGARAAARIAAARRAHPGRLAHPHASASAPTS